MISPIKNFAIFFLIVLVSSCFSKRKYGDHESAGETTNQAVNPLMDGDADVEESHLSIKETKDEENLVARIGAGNFAEIAMADLALEKSDNNEIKDFATMLKNDHQQALDKLKDAVKDAEIKIPTGPSSDIVRKTQDLKTISNSKEFNEEWLEEVISMHKDDIDMLQAHKEDIENSEVRIWIENTLPTIKMHLDRAMALEGRIKG